MTGKIIDGKPVAKEIRSRVSAEAQKLIDAGKQAKLVALQVGDNPSARMYADMQRKTCESVGILYEYMALDSDITQSEFERRIAELNGDDSVSGLILQLPLPHSIDARAMQQRIAPQKDVEGVHPINMGRLFYGDQTLAPCTAAAARELLQRTCDDFSGKEIVIVGHSEIFGKPLATMLLDSPYASPTVTVCHVATKDLAAHTRKAEVLIVAAGVSQSRWRAYRAAKKRGEFPEIPDLSPLIREDMVRDDAIVIDVAINRIPKQLSDDGEPVRNDAGKAFMQTVGDVDYEAVQDKVSAITPVPGGVGPVTVAILLRNTLRCAQQKP